MSPLHAAQSVYHVQPTQGDSNRSATYIGLAGSFNAIGEAVDDNAQLGQFKLHHAGKLGRFQYFGGVQLNAGAYNLSSNYIDSLIRGSRSRFVWSAAVSGGMGYTIPVTPRFDWRIIGIEGNVGVEGGRYKDFRKSVPDSTYQYVDRSSVPRMFFATTEMVFTRRRTGTKIGYQFAIGSNFRTLPSEYDDYYYYDYTPLIIRNTLQITKDPISFHFQINAARYLLGLGTGITYRL